MKPFGFTAWFFSAKDHVELVQALLAREVSMPSGLGEALRSRSLTNKNGILFGIYRDCIGIYRHFIGIFKGFLESSWDFLGTRD